MYQQCELSDLWKTNMAKNSGVDARTVMDQERGHQSAGGEGHVEADQHVGEARRENWLADILSPAVSDGGRSICHCQT
jgi:hypothetical protein